MANVVYEGAVRVVLGF